MPRGRSVEDETVDDGRMTDSYPRRPWALIAACVVLVLLAGVLWNKWSTARQDAIRLDRELKRVYKEAEDLRLQAALAQERITKLERELRALHAERERLMKPAEEKPKPAAKSQPARRPR